ncbi:hypothetical protein SOVF_203330, partial [Spinacia oleracea]
ILFDANVDHSYYDGLLWTLRSLHQLSMLLVPLVIWIDLQQYLNSMLFMVE